MSFRLKMLGGAALLADDGPVTGRATQRRRIALLALLGAAGEGGLSRDRIMPLLWPESDTERGRHLLSDSVYRINQALGGDAIVPINDALALNPERISTDIAEFGAAYDAGDWEAAVACYGGPFLDGFHISDSAELERWIDGERTRFANRYARALEQLTDERQEAGDALGAVESARALASHDPLSARFAMRYMRALAGAGDRALAVRHARVYASLVEQELGVEPDAEVAALAERMSSEPAGRRSELPEARTSRTTADAAAPVAPEGKPLLDVGSPLSPSNAEPQSASAHGAAESSDVVTRSLEASSTGPGGRSRSSRSRFTITGRFAALAAVVVLAFVVLGVWMTSRAGASR